MGNDGHETSLQKREINIKIETLTVEPPAGSKKLEGNIYLDFSAMELLCESHHEEDDFFPVILNSISLGVITAFSPSNSNIILKYCEHAHIRL